MATENVFMTGDLLINRAGHDPVAPKETRQDLDGRAAIDIRGIVNQMVTTSSD